MPRLAAEAAAEAAAVCVAALVVTAALAAPVLRAPSERVFGMEIVGRHADPFTVMAQFHRPISVGVYSQPVTDIPGNLLERVSGPVAAYNWLVLLSFPLSAVAAFLLARHLRLSAAGAAVAAFAYAFSPFHLAHAAYHPHVAQTQWMPLYLLALWRCLDHASFRAVVLLAASTLLVTLSNFYGGLIAAVITLPAIAAYWLTMRKGQARSARGLAITVGSLAVLGGAGLVYAWVAARAGFGDAAALAFPRGDLFRYSAKWWSYLIPPVEHPLLGATVRQFWNGAGVREGLLEHQVSLGWGIIALGLIAMTGWLVSSRREPLAWVPVLAVIAVFSLVCSLSPDRTVDGFTFVRPSALLYPMLPMFRAYARFGMVVQLMAALLAGLGVDVLRRHATTGALGLALLLIGAAAGEYAVVPSALWRDALPTSAHRWMTRQPDGVRALDCTPVTEESASVQWLTRDRVQMMDGWTSDCAEPNLPAKLAALGYTHLLVRQGTAAGQWFRDHPILKGLTRLASFDDGQVFAVTAGVPPIYTAAMQGLFPREQDPEWTWRWMEKRASWTIVNGGGQEMVARLDIEISAFRHAHRLELLLDGRPVQTLMVEPARRVYQVGPFKYESGVHELTFSATELPVASGDEMGNGDGRHLSFALGPWSWQPLRGTG